MKKKSMIVDFDGVLRLWPDSDASLEQKYDIPLGSIRDAAFTSDLLELAIRGKISDSEWRSRIAAKLREQHRSSDVESAVSDWSESIGTVDSDLLDCLLNCRLENGLVLLTNATSRLNSDLTALGLNSAFSDVVNSSEAGYIKPEAEIFQLALEACNCDVEEILFIDDTLANVIAGTSMGIESHHYTGIESLKRYLSGCG